MKMNEEDLLLQISRLESILNHLPFEVWYKDTEGKYIFINKKVEEYFGKPKEEIIGKNDYELYPEDTAELFAAGDRAVIGGESRGFFEFNLNNDTYEDYKSPIFDSAGELIGTTGFSRNISQIKKAHQQLIESERNKSLLLANAPGVAFHCANDADYTVTYLSDSCYALTGYTADELLSMKPSYNDLIHPEYRRALIGKWDSDDQDDTISTDEYPIYTKSGEIKWVMEQSHRTYDSAHRVIGSEGFIIDITQRRLAEKALKQSEERFRAIFEESPLGMTIFDSVNGETYQVNARYAEIVGRTKKELLSTSIRDHTMLDEIEEVRRKIELLNAHQISSFSFYKHLAKPDGTTVWVNITVAPFHSEDEDSNPRLLCMIEDVTARRKAEEEILHLSYYDQLTGLYNRRFYEEELRRIDTGRNLPITLVLADVNGLKLANDAFGHVAGDRLLKHIADTMKKHCRADDLIARVGGDEFILLLPKTDSEQAEKMVHRLCDAIKEGNNSPVVCSVSFGWDTKTDPAEDIGRIYTNAEDLMYRHKLTESAAMKSDTIKHIVRTLFKRNKREEAHAKRVSRLCYETGKAMGMKAEDIRELKLAGLVHNIGYIALRQELLDKKGKYTVAEMAEMERHPEIGYQLLRSVFRYSFIAEYILYHHERIDGKGYPSKAAIGEIPVQAKIIAIADAFAAMTGESGYRDPMSAAEAAEEIWNNAGTQFDSEVAEVFLQKVLRAERELEVYDGKVLYQ